MMSPSARSARSYLVSICILTLINISTAWSGTVIDTPLAGQGKARISFVESPLKSMTEVPFAIELYDAGGEPVEDAELSLSLTMPVMPMPPNHPQAIWKDGAYRGMAVFTMAGAWDINVTIDRQGLATETVVFRIDMVVMK